MANANIRVVEHCYKKAAKKKFIDRPSPHLPPANYPMLSYNCLASLFMNGGAVFRVINFSRHKRLWLVDNTGWQEGNVLVDKEGEFPRFVSYHLFQCLQHMVIKHVSVC